MKSLIAVPVLALWFASAQVSAACLYITDSYGGVLEADAEVVAYGPFSMTAANGCIGATIEVTLSIGGGGKGARTKIERLMGGGAWLDVGGNFGSKASFSGPHGTYRLSLKNPDSFAKPYSGTVNYGR